MVLAPNIKGGYTLQAFALFGMPNSGLFKQNESVKSGIKDNQEIIKAF